MVLLGIPGVAFFSCPDMADYDSAENQVKTLIPDLDSNIHTSQPRIFPIVSVEAVIQDIHEAKKGRSAAC
jgi:hypothetical protein